MERKGGKKWSPRKTVLSLENTVFSMMMNALKTEITHSEKYAIVTEYESNPRGLKEYNFFAL